MAVASYEVTEVRTSVNISLHRSDVKLESDSYRQTAVRGGGDVSGEVTGEGRQSAPCLQ